MKLCWTDGVRLIGAAGVLSLSSSATEAATLVAYDTAASTSNATLSASVAASEVAADALSTGGGLTANTGGTYNWRGWNASNYASAVGGGDAFLWGFDVVDDVTIDLTDLHLRVDRSGTGPDDLEVRVSVNGGAGVSVLTHDYNDSGAAVEFTEVDLSAVPSLGQGDSVVFTLGAFNAESSSGTMDLEDLSSGAFAGRTVVVEGTISAAAVPEPAVVVLGVVGGGLLLRRWGRDTAIA